MSKKLLTILLMLSLGVNVTFIGTGVVQHVLSSTPDSAEKETTPSDSEVWCPLHQELDVTEQQWKKIEPAMREFRRKTRQQKEKMDALRGEMLRLLQSPEVTTERIEAQQRKILEAMRGMQDIVIGHLLFEKKVLNPDQQKKLLSMIEKRMGRPGPGRFLRRRPER